MVKGLRYRHLAVAFAAGAMLLGGCGPSGPRTINLLEGGQWVEVLAVEGTARGELALIELYRKDQEYGKVVEAAEKFYKTYPVDFRRQEVAMFAGHAEMERGNYMKAHEWYTRQLDNFHPGEFSDEALDREYRIADAFINGRPQKFWIFPSWVLPWLKAYEEGIDILHGVVQRMPMSTLAEDALLRIAEYHYADEQWADAADAYNGYLVTFPKRRRAAFARLRAARAIYATYRGAAYDSMPLIKAGSWFAAFAELHEFEAQAEGIDKIIARIREQRAEADFHVAELYERLDRIDAAVYYYKEAASERYGFTTVTLRAEAALERLVPQPGLQAWP